MRIHKQFLAMLGISALIFSPFSAAAIDKEQKSNIKTFDSPPGSEVEAQLLPMRNLFYAKRNNQFVILSGNGRYEVRGYIYDRWMDMDVRSIEDAVYSAEHLPYNKGTKLKLSQLKPLVYGSGPQDVLVFVRPQDEPSHRFFQQIKDLGAEFTFKIIVLPPLTGNPKLTLNYTCPKNSSRALSVLMHNTSYDLLEHLGNCDRSVMLNRTITHHLFGMLETPSVIAPNTRVDEGQNENWKAFLLNNRTQ